MMRATMLAVVVAVVVMVAMAAVASAEPLGSIEEIASKTLLRSTSTGSGLYTLTVPDSEGGTNYDDPVYLLDLHGDTSYQQGYDTGALFGKEWAENYDNLFSALLGDEWWEPAVQELIEVFLDWQWEYLAAQTPQEYIDEFNGQKDGALTLGVEDMDLMSQRGITLANLPSDAEDWLYIIIDEAQNTLKDRVTEQQLAELPRLMQMLGRFRNGEHSTTTAGDQGPKTCSMFGVWGSRTESGNVWTARNLDWMKDLGISKYKLVTVHRPPNGYVHSCQGYAALWGCLAGMSAKGLTVHEANLESDQDSFRGFPWVLRLRYLMSYATNLDEAMDIWADTNNTVGFNHGVGSSADQAFMALETDAGHTAYFHDNDDREKNCIDPTTGEDMMPSGPLEEALVRTNHGCDPETIEHYQWWGYHALTNSEYRSDLLYSGFTWYQSVGTKVGAVEAVNMTALVGQKGSDNDAPDSYYTCTGDYSEGNNILSVTFDPTNGEMYVAWENGDGDDWVPAACNPYVKFPMNDLVDWF